MKKNYWDQIYKKNSQIITWPWSELIGLVNRFALKKKKNNLKVFEFGFGSGPNIPFFLGLNSNYHGVELSENIVSKVKKKFPQIKNNIFQNDFSQLDSLGENFDLVFDRGSITHNNSKQIQKSIDLAFKALKNGGIYIGTDWMSTSHTDFNSGYLSDDKKTKNKYKKGGFKNVGNVHFFNKSEIKKIFKNWKIIYLYKKDLNTIIPNTKFNYSTWSIVAKKDY